MILLSICISKFVIFGSGVKNMPNGSYCPGVPYCNYFCIKYVLLNTLFEYLNMTCLFYSLPYDNHEWNTCEFPKNLHFLYITLSPLEGLFQHVGLAADRELRFSIGISSLPALVPALVPTELTKSLTNEVFISQPL